MSFIHYQVVGHFDPRDPIIFGYPSYPKPVRPVDPDAVSRAIAALPLGMEKAISITERGYVYCESTAAPRDLLPVFHELVKQLADQLGGVVMGQYFEIQYPLTAKAEYEASLQDLQRRWAEYQFQHRKNSHPSG